MKHLSLVEFLKLALDRKLHFKRSWRVVMLMRLTTYENQQELYPFIGADGFHCFFEEAEYLISNSNTKETPIKWDTKIKVPKGFLPNITENIETTFGRILLNMIGFTDEFDKLIPYHNAEFTSNTFNTAYYELYSTGKIERTSMLLNSISRLHMLEADAEFGVPAASIKTFTTHPDMPKLRKQLVEKYKDDINNPIVHAKIDKELVALDSKHYEGTETEKFVIGSKSKNVVRKKMFLMYGSETDMDGKPTPLIDVPLEDGLDMDKMPSWVDAARAGSYGRGALTGLGGYEVKKDERAYGHLEVIEGDCKTKKGLTVTVLDYNLKMYVGMRLLSTNEPLNLDFLNKKINKDIVIRAPSHCALKRSYCEHCMGELAKKDKYGIPAGVMIMDSNSMYAQMTASHGKAVKVNKLELKEVCK